MVPFDTQDLNGVVYVWVGSKADHDDATLTEELAYVIFKVSIGYFWIPTQFCFWTNGTFTQFCY